MIRSEKGANPRAPLLHDDPNLPPASANRLLLAAAGSIELASGLNGHRRGVLELRVPPELVAQGDVPDAPGSLPGVSADCRGCKIESAVRNAGIDVHASVVPIEILIVLHVSGLGVLSNERIVVGRSRSLHRPQSNAVDAALEEPLADEPVRLIGSLPEVAPLDERSEDVGDVLVQCSALPLIDELRLVLRHAMSQLVSDDVDGAGETVEDHAISVAIDHSPSVPEGVVVSQLEVDRGVQPHPPAVDGVAVELLQEQVVGLSRTVVGLVRGGIVRRRIPLAADENAGEVAAVLCVVNRSVSSPDGGDGREDPDPLAPSAHLLGQRQSALGPRPLARIASLGDLPQDVRRDDAAERIASVGHFPSSFAGSRRTLFFEAFLAVAPGEKRDHADRPHEGADVAGGGTGTCKALPARTSNSPRRLRSVPEPHAASFPPTIAARTASS